ncbi:Tyrosine recombinase XerD [subsurface metagenome]
MSTEQVKSFLGKFKKPPRSLTLEECLRLLEKLTRHHNTDPSRRASIRNRLIALVMLDAGLRVGEALQLQIDDLLIDEKPVTSLQVRGDIAKGGEERHIKTTEPLRAAINAAWLFIWAPDKRMPDTYAFYSGKKQTHLAYQHVERILQKAGRKACHRRVTPHMLRHTFGTRLMRVTNIRVVQQLLGHKRLSSTQIYTHPDQEDQDKAIDGMPTGT